MELSFSEWAKKPLTCLAGIGPARASRFSDGLGVSQLGQLIRLIPNRYEPPPVAATEETFVDGAHIWLSATVVGVSMFRPRGRPATVRAVLDSSLGDLEALWFGQPWRRKSLEVNQEICLAGVLSKKEGRPKLLSPRVVDSQALPTGEGLRPVYSEIQGLRSNQIAQSIRAALADAPPLAEILPKVILDAVGVPTLQKALLFLHQPTRLEETILARRRLAWGEVLRMETSRLQNKKYPSARAHHLDEQVWQRIFKRLPFSLNKEQKEVIALLRKDLESGKTIRRLLHGEVGSGKTAVAFALALAVVAQGEQVALLAPTEILARQHLATFKTWLADSKVQVCGLFGDDTVVMRRNALAALSSGRSAIAIGTHALFGKEVAFQKLQLVLFDEQQRFGVRQKSALVRKGKHPHVLTMTATPIPRTLAWARYGALEPCVLRRRIGHGVPIRTQVHAMEDWAQVMETLVPRIHAGERAFVVLPRIDGEDGLKAWHKKLEQKTFADIPMRMVHGRMSGVEVSKAVDQFRSGKISVLLGTSIVEVGLDIADVPLMVILNAQNFGLASLHQLRGRLARGKGASPGECHLLAPLDKMERLLPLEKCDDGFAVAQMDLDSRGPGELLGTRQHGKTGFRVFDPLQDEDLIQALRFPEVHTWLKNPLQAEGNQILVTD